MGRPRDRSSSSDGTRQGLNRLRHLTATIHAITGADGVLVDLAAARGEAIEHMRAAGATWPQIARVCGVTVTRLHQLRRPPTGPSEFEATAAKQGPG